MAKTKLRIADMIPLEKEVSLSASDPDKVITVRPVSLEDIIYLLVTYRDQLLSLWVEGQKPKPDYGAFLVGSKVMVAEIIARASDRMDEIESIVKMPGWPR